MGKHERLPRHAANQKSDNKDGEQGEDQERVGHSRQATESRPAHAKRHEDDGSRPVRVRNKKDGEFRPAHARKPESKQAAAKTHQPQPVQSCVQEKTQAQSQVAGVTPLQSGEASLPQKTQLQQAPSAQPAAVQDSAVNQDRLVKPAAKGQDVAVQRQVVAGQNVAARADARQQAVARVVPGQDVANQAAVRQQAVARAAVGKDVASQAAVRQQAVARVAVEKEAVAQQEAAVRDRVSQMALQQLEPQQRVRQQNELVRGKNNPKDGLTPGKGNQEGESARGKGGSRTMWRVISVVATLVLVASLACLGAIVFSYWQGQDKYVQVRETARVEVTPGNPLASMTVDWETLKETNPDTVAWIVMPDSPIDYPVVQASDNEYYLNHAFDKTENWLASYGTIFLDCTNNKSFKDACNFFYGHHMNDGSMFAFLDKLTNQQLFDENRTIYVLTPEGNYRLKTFAMVVTDGSETIVQTNFVNNADYQNYVMDKINRSCVDAGDDAKMALASSKIFAMSTCDYSREDGRAILFTYVAESTVPGIVGVEQ